MEKILERKKNGVLWRKYCKEKRMAFYGENTVKKKEWRFMEKTL